MSAAAAMPASDTSTAAIEMVRPKARIVSSPRKCQWSAIILMSRFRRFANRRGTLANLPIRSHRSSTMHDDASQQRASRLTGIALMCAAVACFAMLDTTAKYLNLYMNTLQIVWARYTGAFLFPFIVSNPWTTPGLMRTTRPAAADRALDAAARIDAVQFRRAALPAARRGDRAGVLDAVLRRGAVGADAGRVGALAPLGGDRRRLRRRPGGDAPGRRQLPSGGAALALRRGVLRALFHHHPHSRPHRFQRHHACSIRTSSARWCCCRSFRSCGPRRASPSSSR